MSTTTERGQAIYAHLLARLNEPHTLGALLAATGLNPGRGTDAAIRHARTLATAAGLDLPPAVPGNGYVYMVTDQAMNAALPAKHMNAIAAGVNRRAAIEFAFIAATAEATVDHPRLRYVLTRAAGVKADQARHNAAVDAQLAGLMAEAAHIIRHDPAVR